MEWIQAHYYDSSGGAYGPFGIKILIKQNRPLDDEDRRVIQDVVEQITTELTIRTANLDPAIQQARKKVEAEITALFPAPIFVEAIPNGYGSDPFYIRSPWFIITTPIGRIKIGWRKRVIHLEWTETVVEDSPHDLFPHEEVTKGVRSIHCWGYEKAKEYIDKLMEVGLKTVARRNLSTPAI
jgi:hypothetical protein